MQIEMNTPVLKISLLDLIINSKTTYFYFNFIDL